MFNKDWHNVCRQTIKQTAVGLGILFCFTNRLFFGYLILLDNYLCVVYFGVDVDLKFSEIESANEYIEIQFKLNWDLNLTLELAYRQHKQQQKRVFNMKMKDMSPNPNFTIIEVWNSNLDEEFKKIRKIIQKYPFVAMVGLFLKVNCQTPI